MAKMAQEYAAKNDEAQQLESELGSLRTQARQERERLAEEAAGLQSELEISGKLVSDLEAVRRMQEVRLSGEAASVVLCSSLSSRSSCLSDLCSSFPYLPWLPAAPPVLLFVAAAAHHSPACRPLGEGSLPSLS